MNFSQLTRWFRSPSTPARRQRARKQPRHAVRSRSSRLESLEARAMLAGHMQIGMNLENVVDWSPAWTFTDALQASRPWVSHDFNTVTRQQLWQGTQPLQLDANCWPTQLAEWTNAQGQRMQQRVGTLMFGGQGGQYPAGQYRAEWEGTGTLYFGADARVVQQGRTAEGRNFAVLNVTPTEAGINMRIDATSPADPLRNIHVWMPDFGGQSFAGQRWQPGADFSPFHPLFEERLEPFGVIRFMQWQETNSSDIVTWADRRDANDARQHSGTAAGYANGVALEYMVELANQLDADPWFSMPHAADDDFVRRFAEYVRDNLEPGRTAYVEWSNEIWNFAPGFEGSQWIAAQTRLPENAGLTHWQIAGRESKRDLDIWTDVFAGQSQRIVRVAGAFAANDWISARIVESMGNSFDAIAIAPYIGPTGAQRAAYTAATTVDQVLADTAASIAHAVNFTLNHQRLADQYERQFGRDIQVLDYEGGPHLDGRNAVYQNAFYQATNDPRMQGIVEDYLKALDAAGTDLYVHYKFTDRGRLSQWGDFGVLNRQDQPLSAAPKYNTLVDAAVESLYTGDMPLVTLMTSDAQAAEAGLDGGAFRISRSGDLSQPLVVNYTLGGAAVNGTDYDRLSGAVTIPAGERMAMVAVRPIDDTLYEPNETVTLTLAPSTGYQILTAAAGSVTLTSNDAYVAIPQVAVYATDASALERGANVGVFTFLRSGENINQPMTIFYNLGGTAVAGSDYAAMPGSVTIPAGSNQVTVTITPIDDTAVEPLETVIASIRESLAYRISTASQATVSITSDDVAAPPPPPVLPTVTIAATDAAMAEANRDPATFTVSRTGNLSQLLVVQLQTGGTATRDVDYQGAMSSVTIAAGSASATVTLTPVDDTLVETLETAGLMIVANAAYQVGAQAMAMANLTDNDVAAPPPPPVLPTVSIIATDSAMAEANRDPATFTVSRTGDVSQPLTVQLQTGGTATRDADYQGAMNSVTIAAGAATATITLTPLDDSIVETSETASITVVAGSGYQLGSQVSALAMLADNDVVGTLPVLLVIANQDFYYQEYNDTRRALEAAGLRVVVAAERREWARPHGNSGQGTGNGWVMPDLAITEARAADYSTIAFVGGWGASAYQYGFTGTYNYSAYNGAVAVREATNRLINDFVAQDKFVNAICHGVSVLAYARVNGASPIANRTVLSHPGTAPASNVPNRPTSRAHIEANGATVLASRSVGDRFTAVDDVYIDGKFITAENWDSATLFGQTIAQAVRGA